MCPTRLEPPTLGTAASPYPGNRANRTEHVGQIGRQSRDHQHQGDVAQAEQVNTKQHLGVGAAARDGAGALEQEEGRNDDVVGAKAAERGRAEYIGSCQASGIPMSRVPTANPNNDIAAGSPTEASLRSWASKTASSGRPD